MATIEERALEKFPIEMEEVRDPETYVLLDECDINANIRHLYIKWHKEQEAITKQATIARTCEWMRNHNTGEEVIEQYVKDMEG